MKTWKLTLLSAAVMLGLPWLAVTLVSGDAGMAVCFLLFFAVDPIFSVVCGIFTGKDMKKLWFQPILPPLFFLIGAWWFFSFGEPAFLLYAAVYLLLGCLATVVSSAFRSRK